MAEIELGIVPNEFKSISKFFWRLRLASRESAEVLYQPASLTFVDSRWLIPATPDQLPAGSAGGLFKVAGTSFQ
ncbi:hypothetical protein FJV76_13340 [Mesorhizobium sp. WSM4303]|uniref:hypothetical protein n=1 Tax=unclassified Mesorhizobium TaxID=325217 RepID=UPI00115EB171|nr:MULTISPECIES: hypothetical protein [unclassified Mesorhizobium]TRC98301.1 hypothetical protein FJV77_07450 [Mesorhizobium sp. WSM4306]TRD04277.1 hypothetical protein FJV76_13340 [Mesorhizobium sp. WSM4303]